MSCARVYLGCSLHGCIAGRSLPAVVALWLVAACTSDGGVGAVSDADPDAALGDSGDTSDADARDTDPDDPLDPRDTAPDGDGPDDAGPDDGGPDDADPDGSGPGDVGADADTAPDGDPLDSPRDAEDTDADVDPSFTHEPGAPPSPCASHQASCDGVCRAVEVDSEHCGDCDVACDDEQVCEAGACVDPVPAAAPCSDEEVAEVLAPATPESPWVALDCSLTLPPDAVVTKAIRLTGAEASGVVLDCQGATIVRGDPGGGADLVLVESRRVGEGWQRPTDVTIRDCRIEGSVRIRGQGNNGQAAAVTTDSWTPGHRERAQAAAPTRVLLEGLTIVGDGRIPLYLAPGATRVTFRDSEIVGESVSTLVYLDAESAHNRFVGNRFAGDTRILLPREEFAVDGSADNLIAGNAFDGVSTGSIYIYRNCGEGGAVRHQEPRRNVVAGNLFVLDGDRWENPWLWVGSRNEGGIHTLTYCDLDEDYDFGSGASDDDFARDTVVVGNRVVDSPDHPDVSGTWGFEVDDEPTWAEDNLRVGAPVEPLGPVCVVFPDEAPPIILRDGEAGADGRVCADGRLERAAP